jgi:hypothetical protein
VNTNGTNHCDRLLEKTEKRVRLCAQHATV